MISSSEQRRAYQGPVFFSGGFRPFFLSAGLWAVVAMAVWLVYLIAGWEIPSRFTGADWHVHEMVFGYSSAVIAGFLLTAVPNWTGRLPVMGRPLMMLFILWVLGRFAILFSAQLPALIAPLIDLGFLAALIAVIGREILAGKNKRNVKILIILALLLVVNGVYHYEALHGVASRGYGIRFGVSMILMLIMVVGGRVVPSFSRNWLARQRGGLQGRTPPKLPIPFGRFDLVALAVAALTLLCWTIFPDHIGVRILAALAAGLHLIRLSRWRGWETFGEPLVAILHVAYVFIPVGFVMLALGDAVPGWGGAAQIPHAWTVGAIGVMTLAVMSRASLGHSGRPLTSTPWLNGIYIVLVLAVVARISAEFFLSLEVLLTFAALGWILAFTGFVAMYFPMFIRPRL
jgi:uncharacterized protein involved in response to NO